MGLHAAKESIQLENLTKRFGKLTAVSDLTFSVAPGEVLGFLGPNGAGKTTTMRMLLGLINPTSGLATISGFDVSKRNPKMLARIGYLPGSMAAYENLTGHEFLSFLAKIRRKDCSKQFTSLAERFELDLHKHIHDLSKGNRQKIGVVAAFMHEPEVLILDEPTSGLDPLMQRQFEEILSEAMKRGAATLLSSHVMSEVENLSDRVAIIDKGKLLLLSSVADLKQKALRRIELGFPQAVSHERFRTISGVTQVDAYGDRVVLEVTGAVTEVMRLAVELGVTAVKSEEPSLDEIFVSLIDGGKK